MRHPVTKPDQRRTGFYWPCKVRGRLLISAVRGELFQLRRSSGTRGHLSIRGDIFNFLMIFIEISTSTEPEAGAGRTQGLLWLVKAAVTPPRRWHFKFHISPRYFSALSIPSPHPRWLIISNALPSSPATQGRGFPSQKRGFLCQCMTKRNAHVYEIRARRRVGAVCTYSLFPPIVLWSPSGKEWLLCLFPHDRY